MPPKHLPTLSSSSQSQKRRVGATSATSQSVRNRQLQQQKTAGPVQQQRVEESLLDLGHLLPAECEHILAVLERDATVRKQEQERVIRLKKEIRDLRLRGVIRNEPGSDATNSCARCRKSFGWLFNKPIVCVICSHRVCKKCVQPFPGKKNSSLLICTFCLKQMELEAMTGHWFELMMNKGKPGYKAPNPGEQIRASIRRSKQPTTPGSSVGSTFGDVKRALLSRTSIDATSSAISGGLQAPSNYPTSGVDGFDAEERNRKQMAPTQRQQPVNLITGGEDEVKHVRVRRGRHHSSDEDSDDDADRRTTGSGGASGSGRPASASSTSSSTRERQIKPPSPGSSAARLSTGPIWDYRSGVPSGSDRPSQGSSQQQLTNRDRASGYQRDARGMTEFQTAQRQQYYGAQMRGSPTADQYEFDEAFQRGDPVRASMISCASSVGRINVVTSDEDEDPDVDIDGVDVDDFMSDIDSIAGQSVLQVGETPTRSVPSGALPPASSPRFPKTAVTASASPQTRRTLAAAVREKADLALAADASSASHRTTALTADSLVNTTSGSDEDQRAVTQQYLHQQQRLPSEPLPTSFSSSTGNGSATIGTTPAHQAPVQGVALLQTRQASIAGGNGRGTRDEARRGIVNGSSSSSTAEQRLSKGYDEVDLTNGSQVSNGGISTRSTTRPAGTSLKMGPNGTASLGGGLDSDAEENEDIGEMFSTYAKRKTLSQTNLDRMSPFSSSKESIVSLYSNAGSENFGKYPISGDIEFGMAYNYKQSSLEVNIKQCRGVAIVDQKRNSSDPYVKTYLLPDKTKNGKRKTRVKKHTTSPVFDEVIKYHVTKSELESRTLCVMVWNFDRFGRNDFLGEVNVGFDHHSFDDPTPKWHKLQDRQNLSTLSALTYKGDLNIGLRFVSSDTLAARRQAVGNGGSLDSSTSGRGLTATAGQNADRGGELQVVVKQARNLTAVRSNGYSDPFCKCSLLPDRTRGGSQKSPVVKRNCNPVWNHTFVFDCVSWAELKERSLELTVWDYDRIISNDFLGGVRLNLGTGKSSGETVDWMDSKGEEMSLWQAMLDRPNCWIEGTLLLRLHMGQRK